MSIAADHGMSAERLSRIDDFLHRKYIAPGLLPHAQLLIARDNAVVHRFTAGKARQDGTPLREDAIFRIASMTKPITSVAFMMLMERGLVRLDDPVTRVIPEFAGLSVYAGGGEDGAPFIAGHPAPQMRMVDLLTHRAGFTYGIQQRTPVDAAYRAQVFDGHRARYSDQGFIDALANIPLEFAPGSGWNYSVATDVLGVVIARLSGMRLGDFLRTHIFDPLGMTDTGFDCPQDKKHRIGDCWVYAHGRPLLLADRAETSQLLEPAAFDSGGAGLLSTTADYDRFCRMLLNGGSLNGVQIVSPTTLRLMTRNHLPNNDDLTSHSSSMFSEANNAGVGFGLGFGVTIDPLRTLTPGSAGEFFWGGIYSTAFFVDPVERLHMIFMTQFYPSMQYDVRRELRALIYSALTQSYQ